MEKLKMLWTGEYNEYWDRVFTENFDLVKAGRAFPEANSATHRMTEDELIPMLRGVDIFLDGYDRVTERVIKESPDLKLIMSIRDGPEESVDIEACTKAGLPVLFPGGRYCGSPSTFSLRRVPPSRLVHSCASQSSTIPLLILFKTTAPL